MIVGDDGLALPGPLVSVDWLAAHLADPALVVLDAHVGWGTAGPDARLSLAQIAAGHIPGARFADLVEALSDGARPFHFANPAPDALARALAALGVGADRQVVIYDRGLNMWAARLWWMLRAIGVTAAVLDGGWEAWRAAGHPIATGAPRRPNAVSSVSVAPEPLFADLEDVAAIVAGTAPSRPLVCALPVEIFSGETALYGRSGHIPGSLSLPAASLLDEHGRFLAPALLAARLQPLIGGPAPILYCGGGVSAAVIALALVVIGRGAGARIYDGSLEEWGADGARPLATSHISKDHP
ncbi:sulfurtransferase [Sphingomonas abietis]|uniref:Rhodanese-like domain-containing protein n=1 Tax=Sphingomonas abietis TaxID=3012344 RepID=A0ABY7NNR3_9SPHN|nr:rhodanese-like domain-containing protein [Sphingomonas abietis]WBO21554.1 rhodanese-like domain-containing protein [Sphingomonas abietis]